MALETDQKTTVAELRNFVQEFVDERQWQKFHTPKNLSMALSIEVAELMEHFQWLEVNEAVEHAKAAPQRDEIQEELADVLCYVLALANSMDIDLTKALDKKMVKNRVKYPAEEYMGKF